MSLEQDLKQEQVVHLDLSHFAIVKTGTSVKETVEKMRSKDCGCAFVVDRGCIMGIFTDRDILRKVVDAPDNWNSPINDVMTLSPITVRSKEAANKAFHLMNEKHFRNVPVLNAEGYVVGAITHYSIIKYLADRFPESIYNLPPDPERVTNKRSGA